MRYFSTNKRSPAATFREAVLAGQPDDMGLYVPAEVPPLEPELLRRLAYLRNDEIALKVIRHFVDEIPEDELYSICAETVDFDFPLVPLSPRISALELFHGPTLAFKDVGARFMSRCLGHFSLERSEKTIVIVATSGDTGSAVAAGFHGVAGVEVVILYPKGRVSEVQELQLTTWGGNVTTLELRGSFDDCQALAKRALADADLRTKTHLTSANSINVARWLPQQFYYLFAMKQWDAAPPVISVPSGNFGNIAAGLLAFRRGLPADSFIAACNANDVVPRFLNTGTYEPRATVPTMSNAMDVGAPSNWVRIMEMFGGDIREVRSILKAVSIDDTATAATIRDTYESSGYVLDPHGAVAYRALADHLARDESKAGLFLETAHPVKFDRVVEAADVAVPRAIEELKGRRKQAIEIDNDYAEVREVVLSRI